MTAFFQTLARQAGKKERFYRTMAAKGARSPGPLNCWRFRVTKRNGEKLKIDAEVVFEVKGYWNEMHLPHEMVRQFGFERGDSAEIILYQIINYREAMAV